MEKEEYILLMDKLDLEKLILWQKSLRKRAQDILSGKHKGGADLLGVHTARN